MCRQIESIEAVRAASYQLERACGRFASRIDDASEGSERPLSTMLKKAFYTPLISPLDMVEQLDKLDKL